MQYKCFRFLELPIIETRMEDLHFFQLMSSNKTITSIEDVLFNKYAIIGVILFFFLLLIIVILIKSIRAYRGNCCKKQDMNLYSQMTEDGEVDDDVAALDDIQDNSFDRLYTSCQLCVGDHEVNTSMESVYIHGGDCDFEYDCSSLDNSVIGLVETQHVSDNSYSSDSSFRRGSLKILSLFKRDQNKFTSASKFFKSLP